jgi:hypothetical protein
MSDALRQPRETTPQIVGLSAAHLEHEREPWRSTLADFLPMLEAVTLRFVETPRGLHATKQCA